MPGVHVANEADLPKYLEMRCNCGRVCIHVALLAYQAHIHSLGTSFVLSGTAAPVLWLAGDGETIIGMIHVKALAGVCLPACLAG